MAKPTVVATSEVMAQGAVLEVSLDGGGAGTWAEVKGLESVPRVGTEGSFIEVQSIDETVKRYIAGMKTPPEWELPFRRIGNDTVQDSLKTAATSSDPAVQLIHLKVTYQTGDVGEFALVCNGYYGEEAAQGDQVQMFAIKGQQSGDVTWTAVA